MSTFCQTYMHFDNFIFFQFYYGSTSFYRQRKDAHLPGYSCGIPLWWWIVFVSLETTLQFCTFKLSSLQFCTFKLSWNTFSFKNISQKSMKFQYPILDVFPLALVVMMNGHQKYPQGVYCSSSFDRLILSQSFEYILQC